MSTQRRLVFALLVTLLVLGGLELGLRVIGVVEQDSLLSPLLFQQPVDRSSELPVQNGWVRWDDGTLHHPQLDGLRIVTVGGSATQGDQVTPFADFSHQLQRLLVRALPDSEVEVLNLGRGGVGSRQVVRILDQGLASFHPQLAVVYAGNNEFHELRALKHASPAYLANMERMRRRLHGLRTYRLLLRSLGRDRLEPIDLGQGTTPPVHELPTVADENDRALARQLYRENLERMVAVAKEAGIPILLSTVADNRAGWHDQPPQTHMTQEEEHILAELDTLRMQRDRAGLEALAAESWSSLVDERAFYRTGRALLELGATDPARRFLDQAELVMARPNRSNNELREVVREVAADHGVPLCDLAAQLDRYAEHGIAGNDLFADACHPNALGHALMAQILAGCAQQAGLFPDGLPADPRWEEPLPVDPLRLDHDARRLDAEPLGAVDTAPELADAIQAGHQAFSAQRYDQAWAHYARALDAGGAPGALLSNQALVRWHQGRMDDVETILEQALEAAPEDEELRNWSGLLTR